MRIAISTGGGDAPGLNSVIRAATLSALRRGWEVVGIRDGFNGLMFPEQYPETGGVMTLTRDFVRGISHLGGTVLGSTNRGDPTAYPVQSSDGTWTTVDRTTELVGMFQDAGIDALITIGGDGSLTIGRKLSDAGLRVIGVPKTIDNDLEMTDATFGFDTAVGVATEGIDRLFTTATSHSRVFVVELMGRYAGWIALNAGMAAGAHAILIPEIPFDLQPVADMIARREARSARFAGGGAPRCDGRAPPAGGELRAAGLCHQEDAQRPSRLRHHPRRARSRGLLRRRVRRAVLSEPPTAPIPARDAWDDARHGGGGTGARGGGRLLRALRSSRA